MYFNERAIFHIKLVSKEVNFRGLSCHAKKAYMILEGRIYRAASLSDILLHRMFNALVNFERCFDKAEDMAEWNLMEGYSWQRREDTEEEEYIQKLIREFGVSNLRNVKIK